MRPKKCVCCGTDEQLGVYIDDVLGAMWVCYECYVTGALHAWLASRVTQLAHSYGPWTVGRRDHVTTTMARQCDRCGAVDSFEFFHN